MHGLIIVDKPSGPTSAEVVRLIKARLGRKVRVGHLGTLDPFASGVLPIMVGEGTKLAPFIQDGDKKYCGVIGLGAETDTLDHTGTTIRSVALPVLDNERLAALAQQFTGSIDQTPPVFSAIKRGGVPLYKLARRGVEVAPPESRRVEIKSLELQAEGAAAIRFTVVCSPGMYVRALARDLANALGSAGHLTELRRSSNGRFDLARAIDLAALLRNLEAGDLKNLINLREALVELPEIELDQRSAARLRDGDARVLDGLAPPGAGRFKVLAQGRLLALATPVSRMTCELLRVFLID